MTISPLQPTTPPQAEELTDPDADTPFDYPEHRTVQAADTKPVKTTAARSIFDIAAWAESKGFAMQMILAEMPVETAGPTPWAATVTRKDGRTLVVGAQYPANRWTDERTQELRERQALFRPPRPAKGAKTRGKKVRAWDGEGYE